jgi:hypothetical protein
MNRYVVKIDDTILPDSYTLDELLANGLLDQRDEHIQIKMVEEDNWVVARDYSFSNAEANTNGTVNADGTINRPKIFDKPSRPDSNMLWAILSTLFCCLPLGIVSIIYAAKVDGLYGSGDYEGAKEASDKAMKFAQYGAACFIALIVFYIVLGLVASTMH